MDEYQSKVKEMIYKIHEEYSGRINFLFDADKGFSNSNHYFKCGAGRY